MLKHELLAYLANYRNYFNKISLDDFALLNSLESSELGLMNYDNYRVTPLLQQICKYSLVDTNLTKEDIVDVKNNLSINSQKELLKEALDIAYICHQYVDLMLQEGSNHPCLINVNCLRNGAFLYSQIMNIMCELIEATNGNFQDDLIDLGNIVDEKIMDIADIKWNNLLKIIEDKEITSGVDILNNLSNYLKDILVLGNFFSSNQNYIYYIRDKYIQFVDRKNIHPNFNISTGDCIIGLSIIIEKAHKYCKYCSDEDVLELVKNLEEGYDLYNSYRYLYLKNQYQEIKMLEKCKKM